MQKLAYSINLYYTPGCCCSPSPSSSKSLTTPCKRDFKHDNLRVDAGEGHNLAASVPPPSHTMLELTSMSQGRKEQTNSSLRKQMPRGLFTRNVARPKGTPPEQRSRWSRHRPVAAAKAGEGEVGGGKESL